MLFKLQFNIYIEHSEEIKVNAMKHSNALHQFLQFLEQSLYSKNSIEWSLIKFLKDYGKKCCNVGI